MIRVVIHDPAWVSMFESEGRRIMDALGDTVLRIHHIGSTAIPRMVAKPVIDILLEVSSLEALDEKAPVLERLGFEVKGEFGIAGRRYFRLNDSTGKRTHQVHAFRAGTPNAVRHIAFRDYMRAHPSVAAEYGALKARLAGLYPNDMATYIAGKDLFVKEHERRALLWINEAMS